MGFIWRSSKQDEMIFDETDERYFSPIPILGPPYDILAGSRVLRSGGACKIDFFDLVPSNISLVDDDLNMLN